MISFKEVVKGFGPKIVLQGFTLEVLDGETMIILGYSGTGKSVALKHVVGLLDPDSGRVEVDGQIVHMLDRDGLTQLRSTIGYVFQSAALFDSMTVEQNLSLALKRRRLGAAEISDRVAESLAVVDMEGTEASITSRPAAWSPLRMASASIRPVPRPSRVMTRGPDSNWAAKAHA